MNCVKILFMVIMLSSCSQEDKYKHDLDSYLETIHLKDTYFNKNYIGMTRQQIIYIFGIPIISDSFDDVYHYSISRKINKNFFQKKILSLYFKDNKVFNYEIN